MREVVDKHFPDNWIISFYMGATADLSVIWQSYRAAKDALHQTVQFDSVRETGEQMRTRMESVVKDVRHYLTDVCG
jgi:WASH complex subunit strumpellin